MTEITGTILVVDDDPAVRLVLSTLLESEGYQVFEAAESSSCLRLTYDHRPDLVLLDIMMPGRDGREVCRLLRDISPELPIIMLTALSDESEKVGRFEDGADDFITKPFRNAELVARIRAMLRRARQAPQPRSHGYHDSMVDIDLDAKHLTVNAEPVPLTATEWRILEQLVTHKDRLVSREDLLRHGWGKGFERDYGYLKVHISHLRQKMGDSRKKRRYIHTAREQGYTFKSHA
ncbi:MAG: response regulator transcription factor [Chloroflexi bacterium]|nr:response regulator transcription factor [Chloroflexota bacterium]